MTWEVETTYVFDEWFLGQDDFIQGKIREAIERLKKKGPNLGRPDADSLYGSKTVSNLKELRVNASGRPYRIFFAFKPDRKGLLLCGGVIKNPSNYQSLPSTHLHRN